LGTRTSKLRRTAGVTVSAVLVLGIAIAPAAWAGGGVNSKVLRMVNATRDSHHLHTVRIDSSLTRDALRHTRRMVTNNAIFDPPNLTRILQDEPWDDVGASVVGCAGTLSSLHDAFMHDPAHRDILLNPMLRRIGIGVIRVDSTNACGRHWLWATELFYG
jgi:Cysteine-rich secretory protein family